MEENKKLLSQINIGLHLAYMVIGYLGIQFIAIIMGFILNSIRNTIYIDESSLDAILLFLSYGVTTIIFIFLGLMFKPFPQYIKNLFQDKKGFIEGIIFSVCAFSAAMGYSILSFLIFGDLGSNANQEGLEVAFTAKPFLSYFYIVIFAPICEELTYRFGLFGCLEKYSKKIAWIITILVFALIHFDFTSFSNIDNLIVELVNLPSYLIGSIVLTYAYARKNNILTSITAHMFYNLSQFILMYISIFLL